MISYFYLHTCTCTMSFQGARSVNEYDMKRRHTYTQLLIHVTVINHTLIITANTTLIIADD